MRFWAATFTQYGQRDVVIHDRVQLGPRLRRVRDVASSDDPRVQAGDRRRRSSGSSGRRRRGPLALLPATRPGARAARAHPDPSAGMRETVRAGSHGRTAVPAGRPARPRGAKACPLDLAALPLVESAYHPGIVSSAGAVGLWQLTADVADRYLTHRRQGRRAARPRALERRGGRPPARPVRAVRELAARAHRLQSRPDGRRARARRRRLGRPRQDRHARTTGRVSASRRGTSTRRSSRPDTCSGTRRLLPGHQDRPRRHLQGEARRHARARREAARSYASRRCGWRTGSGRR